MFSRKRRMPPIARRRKAQLTIPSKFWKPELDKTYQKFDTVYFYGDLWIEREKNLARIVTNLQDMRESLGLWIGLSGWLLRTWRCCNWKIGKKRMQALLSSFAHWDLDFFFCRIVISFFWQPWHLLWQCPPLWMWNWFFWACIVFHSQFQVLKMFWMVISESGNQSDIEADVLPRLWHSWLYKGKYWPATHIVFSHFSFL